MRAILTTATLFVLAGSLSAGDNEPVLDPAKLVGKWEAKGDPEKRLVVFEFEEQGGLVVRITRKGEESKAAGKYQIEGRTLTLTLKIAGVEDSRSVTVAKLTDGQLFGTGEKGRPLLLVRMRDK
ncbi:hypothetical protein GobsT_62550 [Gemmata obscuriglobus]|uniref:TIGR03066 family protein n=1 Tax=Gemmata obscuriglobus TaxID=114 RepID=A0A2Z3GRQ0_9BACT|nr:TIGR03066 family protein [Gemmata obscuriglobus]AWM35998.1 TIGR03066 family protein [Gemmata obscuriglobus]QEG31433.1 hypothetical protein GobsT_62550 [Gemmata obscuriglobus]VTS10775.1 unnamed protein product [Gemmata obscuriglobus UQM 2246]